MTTQSDNASDTAGLVTYKLIVEGMEVPGKYGVGSLSVYRECNRIPTATLRIYDGDAAKQRFDASNEDFFIPGKKIEIKIGYKSLEKIIFKGVIISHSVKVNSDISALLIECKDEAFKMTMVRKSHIFSEIKDSAAIEELISNAGLIADVESSNQTHHELVQYYSTDWDFMVSRAQVCGKLCTVDDGKITIKKPDLSQEPVMDAEYGTNIFSFDAEIDARNQFDSYKATTWDFSSQAIADSDSNNPDLNKAGNLSDSDLAKASGSVTYELKHTGYLKSDILQEWVDAKSALQQLSKMTGTLKLQGNPNLKPGMMLNLKGISDRFNGKVFVSGVFHTISEGNWFSDVQFGLNPEWFAETYDIQPLPASGMIPAVHGLQIGVVTALEGDPDNEYRIKVKIPVVNADDEGIWARILSPYAGKNYGIQFLPEIGDEVLLGFLNADPNQAVVLGSMFSSAKTAPISFTDNNFQKIIMGTSEIKIEFNDDKKSIRLESPAGKIIEINEDSGSILVKDENNNKIELTSDGINISSDGKITIKATGDVTIEGNNVDIKANASLKAKGTGSAEISSSGTMTVKGSMVQIN